MAVAIATAGVGWGSGRGRSGHGCESERAGRVGELVIGHRLAVSRSFLRARNSKRQWFHYQSMWKLLAQSVAGSSHLRLGLPCQDACNVACEQISEQPIIILTCADG